MNLERYLKKELLYSQIFIFVGIVAGIAGFIFRYQKELMFGLTIGFLAAGIGTMLVYKYAKNKPEMRKNLELQYEERNIFVNTKAGHTAFWISYWYIFIAAIFSYSLRISLQQFLIITLFFMPFVYFLVVFIYHKKY